MIAGGAESMSMIPMGIQIRAESLDVDHLPQIYMGWG